MKTVFYSSDEEVLSDFLKPEISKNFIPDWYKKMPKLSNDELIIDQFGNPNATVKMCVPFKDAMTAGYIIPLPYDLDIRQSNNNINITKSYQGIYDIFVGHDASQYFLYPIPKEYNKNILKFHNPWTIKTQKGWSTFFLTPIHHELPFHVLSGIVDTDKHPLSVSILFFIRKDFNGVIKKGTPLVQCIPFKREKINAYICSNTSILKKIWRKVTTKALNRYKENFHTKKKYDLNDKSISKCPFSNFFK
jgi:hypothetical protein